MNITTDDILDAIRADIELRKAATGQEGATGPEIALAARCAELTARKRYIRPLLEQGRLEVVELVRTRCDGIETRVRGYRLKA